jgi:hypothetical protein
MDVAVAAEAIQLEVNTAVLEATSLGPPALAGCPPALIHEHIRE